MEAGDNWKVSLWPSKLRLRDPPTGDAGDLPWLPEPLGAGCVCIRFCFRALSRYWSPSRPSQSHAGCLSPGVAYHLPLHLV